MPVAPRARRKKILACLLGLAGAFALAEAVCRVDALFPGAAYSAESMRGFLVERAETTRYAALAAVAPAIASEASDYRPVPDPWSGWTSPNQIETISRGTRWFEVGRGLETFDVVLLGGSFAAQLGNQIESEMPDWIADLPAIGGKPVVLWNLSLAAQKQPSELDRLTWVLALGWKPDLVVCVDGYNDLALSAENCAADVHPAYPVSSFWGGIARSGDVDLDGLDLLVVMRAQRLRVAERARLGLAVGAWRSALLSRACSAWMSGAQADFRAAQASYSSWLGTERTRIAVRGPVRSLSGADYTLPGAIEPAGVLEGIRAWRDGARNLRAICDARHVPLVHAIQPALDDADSKPASEEERHLAPFTPRWRSAIRNGYPLLRAAAAELTRAGVVVADGSRVFEGTTETMYADWCHLNGKGYRAFAGWIREGIARSLERN